MELAASPWTLAWSAVEMADFRRCDTITRYEYESHATDHCRQRLASFKVPRQLIIRDSLPRNPSGKVLKRVLRAELEASA